MKKKALKSGYYIQGEKGFLCLSGISKTLNTINLLSKAARKASMCKVSFASLHNV